MRNRHDRSHGSLRGGNRRRFPILAFVVAAVLSIQCDAKLAEFFGLIDDGLVPGQGDIFGRVTVDGSGRSGVTVTVRQGGQVVTTTTTDSNGDYEVLNLDPGTYTVSVTAPPGTTCPGEQTAVVVADDETQVNFACTTPTPATGTVTGQVTVGGSGRSGVTVELRQGTTVIDTEITNATGNYTFPNVTAGSYTVRITRPANTTCDGTVVSGSNDKPATVAANQTTTVNFACTEQQQSTIPTTSQIQGPWTYMRTRTSVQGSCTAALDPTGTGSMTALSMTSLGVTGLDPQQTSPITGPYTPTTGVYTGTGSVLLGNGFTVNTGVNTTFAFNASQMPIFSGTMTRQHVFGGSTVCTEGYQVSGVGPTPSSIRFKRGVTALLPDGASIFGLRPVAFRYRAQYGDPSVPQIGLIAEEVFRAFPGAVALGADGRPFGIRYATLTGLVIGEIETRARRSMEARIARLAEALK